MRKDEGSVVGILSRFHQNQLKTYHDESFKITIIIINATIFYSLLPFPLPMYTLTHKHTHVISGKSPGTNVL